MWPIKEDSGVHGYRRGIVWFSTTMRAIPTITSVFSAGASSNGIQNQSIRSFTPYGNGVAATGENQLNSWTASAEL
jgi:hypothetical protein